jgi:nicastrin
MSEMESNGVKGVLILGYNLTDSTLASHSPDAKTPNEFASLYKEDDFEHEWNPTGTGLSQMSFTFPISVLRESSQSYLEVIEALEFNKDKNYNPPSFAMQWNSRMDAAVNSKTCLRRDRCSPIGGYSVWTSFSNYSDRASVEITKKPMIFLNSWLGGEVFLNSLSIPL